MSGSNYVINQEERNTIIQSNGFVFLKRLDVTINTSCVSSIEPVGLSIPKIDRNKQQIGVSESGEIVVKRFGTWYYQKSNNPYQYDKNGLCMLVYEGSPIVPTPEEYEKVYKDIDPSLWKNMLIGSSEKDTLQLEDDGNRTSTNGLTKIVDK
jgi:hypothetical protein